jgi:hypothetical protein
LNKLYAIRGSSEETETGKVSFITDKSMGLIDNVKKQQNSLLMYGVR